MVELWLGWGFDNIKVNSNNKSNDIIKAIDKGNFTESFKTDFKDNSKDYF